MRFTVSAFVFFTTITICSIFVANVANLIRTDSDIIEKLQGSNILKREVNELPQMTNNADHLMWFIQITDLHISIFNSEERIREFKEFAGKTVDAVKPSVVLASGDLTDAKTSDLLGSIQYEEEWKTYHNILYEANIRDKTTWLDIRGNHDNFNVPGYNSSVNYFNKYSVQGAKNNKRSYMHQKTIGLDKYSFIAVDACLEPGPKRPFNFIGLLNPQDTRQLINFVHEARNNKSNYIIWFGHYPTSCILAPGTGSGGIRNVFGEFKEGYVYLCGHLHKVGGMIPNMYTLHKQGFLELELGDWKDNRMYRIAAMDHGIFSFTDVVHNDWPVLLLTNPKNPLYRIPTRENLKTQIESTHIRILAFSTSAIVEVLVRIDNENWQKCEKVTDNLFVLKWNAKIYGEKVHYIEASVRDEDSRFKKIRQPFSNGDVDFQFSKLARFVLTSDVTYLFKTLFWFAVCMCTLPLCFMRVWHILVTS